MRDWEADLWLRIGPGAREVAGGHPRTHPEAGSARHLESGSVNSLVACTRRVYTMSLIYNQSSFHEKTIASGLGEFRLTSKQGSCCIPAQVLGRGFHHLSHSYSDLTCHFWDCVTVCRMPPIPVLREVQSIKIEIRPGMISVNHTLIIHGTWL